MNNGKLPPFLSHVVAGASFGALLGTSIAAGGWYIRSKNSHEIDLRVQPPPKALLAKYRPLAECLVVFRDASDASPAAREIYERVIAACEFVAQHDAAKGGTQIAVQKRVSEALSQAKQLAHEAFKQRNMYSHDARLQVEELRGHLTTIQKNMMM